MSLYWNFQEMFSCEEIIEQDKPYFIIWLIIYRAYKEASPLRATHWLRVILASTCDEKVSTVLLLKRKPA